MKHNNPYKSYIKSSNYERKLSERADIEKATIDSYRPKQKLKVDIPENKYGFGPTFKGDLYDITDLLDHARLKKEQEDALRKADLKNAFHFPEPSNSNKSVKNNKLTEKEEVHEEVEQPEDHVSNRDLFVTNSKEQNANVEKKISDETKGIDEEILKLQNKKQQLERLLEFSRLYTSSPAGVQQMNNQQKELDDVSFQLDQLERRRDNYVAGMRLAGNSYERASGIITDITKASDYYRNIAANYSKDQKLSDLIFKTFKENNRYLYGSEMLANEVRHTQGTSKPMAIPVSKGDQSRSNIFSDIMKFVGGLFKKPTTEEPAAMKKVTDSVRKTNESKRKYEETLDEFTKVNKYINDRLEKGQAIPSSISQFPVELRETARKAFTVNGQFVLENEDVRKNIIKNSVVNLDQLNTMSDNMKKSLMTNSVDIDQNQIQNRIDQLEQQMLVSDNAEEKLNLQTQRNLLDKALYTKKMSDLLTYDIPNNDFEKASYKRERNKLLSSATSFFNFATNPNTWLFDAVDINNSARLLNVNKKIFNGEKLTQSEKQLAEAAVINDIYSSNYGDFERYDSYNWSSIAAESLKFMAEFIATNGLLNSAQKLASKATEKYIKKYALENVTKFGQKVAKKTLQVAPRLLADGTYSAVLSNTLGAPRIILDTLNEMQGGNIASHKDEYGNIHFDGVKDKETGELITEMPTLTKSLFRSEVRNWIENFSEMMGEYELGSRAFRYSLGRIPTGASAKNGTNTLNSVLHNIQNDMIKGNKIDAIHKAKDILINWEKNHALFSHKLGLSKYIPELKHIFNSEILKAGQFHGFTGEIAEEYYGLVLQHLLGVQDNENKGLVQDMIDQTRDIVGGIAVSTAILGAFGMGSAIRLKIKFQNASLKLDEVFGDKSYDIQRQLAFANIKDFIRVSSGLLNPLSARGKDYEKYKALNDYVDAVIKYKGAAYGEYVANYIQDNLYGKAKKEARDAGYTYGSYSTSKQMQLVTDIIGEEVKEMAQSQPFSQKLDEALQNDKIGQLIDDIESGEITLPESVNKDNLIGIVLALLNAKAYLDGSNRSIAQNIEDQKSFQRLRLRKLVNIDNKYGEQLIVIIGLPKKDKDGNVIKGEYSQQYALVRGDLPLGTDRRVHKQTEKNKDERKNIVLLADISTGLYHEASIDDLEGFEFTNTEAGKPAGFSLHSVLESTMKKMDQIQNDREKKFTEDTINMGIGATTRIGDRMLTILNISKNGSIDYSLSDENGENASFYTADSYNQLKQTIEQQKESDLQKIVANFKDAAKVILEKQRNHERLYKEILDQRYEARFNREAEMLDFDDTIDTTSQNTEEVDSTEDESKESEGESAPSESVETEEKPKEDEKDSTESEGEESEEKPDETQSEKPGEEPSEEPKKDKEEASVTVGAPVVHSEGEAPKEKESNGGNEDQQKAFDKLIGKITEYETQNNNRVTGFHYFLTKNGKTKIFRRMHSVMLRQKDMTEVQRKFLASCEARLNEYLESQNINKFDVQGFIDLVKLIQKSVVDEFITNSTRKNHSEEYIKYKREQYNNLISYGLQLDTYKNFLNECIKAYKLTKNAKEFSENIKEVISGISNILAENVEDKVNRSGGLNNPSLILGSIYDEILRLYLDNGVAPKYEDIEYTAYGTKHKLSLKFEAVDVSGNKVQVDIISRESFSKIISDIQNIVDYYKRRNVKLITKGYLVHGQMKINGKVVNVAGVTDCIAVYPDGSYLLIDFKTYNSDNKTYVPVEEENGMIRSNIEFYSTDEHYNMSSAEQYSQQLLGYSLLAEWTDGIKFDRRMVMLFGVARHNREGVVLPEMSQDDTERCVNYTEKETEFGVENVPNIVYLDEDTDVHDDLISDALKKFRKRFGKVLDFGVRSGDELLSLDSLIEQFKPEYENENQEELSNEKELRKALDLIDDELTILSIKYPTIDGNGINADNLSELDKNNIVYNLMKAMIIVSKLGMDVEEDRQGKIVKFLYDFVVKSNLLDRLNNKDDLDFIDEITYKNTAERLKKPYTQITKLVDSSSEDSVQNSVGDKGHKLVDVISRPDFLSKDNTRLQFVIKPGTENKKFPTVLLQITYITEYEDGVVTVETFSGVEIGFAHQAVGTHLTDEAWGLYSAIVEGIKAGNVVTMSPEFLTRTNGIIDNWQFDNNASRVAATGLAIHNYLGSTIYGIQYGANSTDFGLTASVTNGKDVHVVVQAPSDNSREKTVLYRYYTSKDVDGNETRTNGSNPASGVVVMMVRPLHNEKNETNSDPVPINMFSESFGENEAIASFVTDLITGNYLKGAKKGGIFNWLTNEEYFVYNGKTTPISVRSLINLFISIDADNFLGKEHVHLEFPEGKPGVVQIVGKIQGVDSLVLEFDMTNDEGINAFKAALSKVRIQINEKVLKANFGNDQDVQNIFGCTGLQLLQFMSDNGLNEISFGNGSDITLSVDDLERDTPIHGIGWYVRNGMLYTKFRGFEHPLIGIDDENAVISSTKKEDNQEEEPKQGAEQVGQSTAEEPLSGETGETEGNDSPERPKDELASNSANEQFVGLSLDDMLSDGLASKEMGTKPGVDFIDEEHAKKVFNRIIGTFPVDVEDELVDSLTKQAVGGLLRSNCLKVSRKAAKNVEYHEAFHVILELVIPKFMRKAAYNKYRERFGKDLTDRQIAEIAADEFKMFASDEEALKSHRYFGKLFTRFNYWYKFYSKIGSVRLAALYASASLGLWRYKKPSKEAIERFKQFEELYSFEVAGMKGLTHFLNTQQYEAAMNTLRSIAMDPRTYESLNHPIDALGRNINRMKLNVPMIVKSPMMREIHDGKDLISREAYYRILELLGFEIQENEGEDVKISYVNAQNADTVIRQVLNGLSKFAGVASTKAAKLRDLNNKNYVNNDKLETLAADSDDPDVLDNLMAQEKNGWTKEACEYSAIDKASAEVKFFFARVWKKKDMPYLVENEDGTVSVKHKVVLDINAAGLPECMDMHTVWNIVLNALHDCDSIYDLYTGLDKLIKENPQFYDLKPRLEELLDKAFKKENGNWFNAKGIPNGVLDQNAYGLLLQIVDGISLAKTIPNILTTYLSDTNKDEVKGSTKVIDANNDYICTQLRSSWGRLLISGEHEFAERDVNSRSNDFFPALNGLGHPLATSTAHDLFNLANFITSKYREGEVIHKINATIHVQNADGTFEYRNVNKEISNKNLLTEDSLYLVKSNFVYILNKFGISFSIYDLDYMLNDLYGGSGLGEFQRLLKDKSKHIDSFVYNVTRNFGDKRDDVNVPLDKMKVANMFNNDQLAQLLSTYIYKRAKETKELQFLTINGKRIYAISEHNYITDELKQLLEKDSKKLKNRANDPYFMTESDVQGVGKVGSLALDCMMRNAQDYNFVFQSLYGLKTDAVGSSGVEYLDLSTQEDIIVKYAVLSLNGMLFPTMSDKTTYGGVFDTKNKFKLLGIDWTDKANSEMFSNQAVYGKYLNDYVTVDEFGQHHINFSTDILDYFINIYKCEYTSARYELNRVGLKDEDKVDNFHSATVTIDGEDYEIRQGARLSTFIGIIDDNGNFISFNCVKGKNGEFLDEKSNLDKAKDYFFEPTKEVLNGENKLDYQRRMVKRILEEQVLKELEYLAQNDMIYLDLDGMWHNGKVLSLDTPKLRRMLALLTGFNKNGRMLTADEVKLDTKNKEKNKEKQKNSEDQNTETNAYNVGNYQYEEEGKIHNNAIVAYVADMVVKQQQSMQENLRLYGGNFAGFKWKYDSKTGLLMDTTTDFFKRTGGYVSTGKHCLRNVMFEDLVLSEDVNCAEVFDEKVIGDLHDRFVTDAIGQEIINQYMDVFMRNFKTDKGIIRLTYDTSEKYRDLINQKDAELQEIFRQVKLKIKELGIEENFYKDNYINKKEGKKKFEASVKFALKPLTDMLYDLLYEVYERDLNDKSKAEENARKITDSVLATAFNKASALTKVDVNDGATFISAKMAKKLLISIGKWNKDIEKAFDILEKASKKTDENGVFTNRDLMLMAEAYNLVSTSLFAPLKYTAYGVHSVEATTNIGGKEIKYTRNTTYYDKTAYFVIFSCMATGHMKAILEKMNDPNNPVDVLKIKSAIKEGGKGAVPLGVKQFEEWDADPSGQSYKNFKFNTYKLNIRDFRKQFNTDPKEGEHMMHLGTQYVKVILSLLKAHQVYDIDGVEMSAAEVRKQIMDAFNGILDANVKKFEAKYFKNGSLDIKEFVRMLEKQIGDRESGDPIKDALSIKDGKLKLPVSALGSTLWIESIVTSVINKELVDVNMPGAAFYQRPDFGVEGQMKFNYANQEDFDYTINHGAKLKQVNEQGSLDCVLSIDYFDFIFEEHPGIRNQSFEEKKHFLIKHGIISGWDQRLEHEGKKVVLIDNVTTFTLTREGQVYKDEDGNIKEATAEDVANHKEVTGTKWLDAETSIVGYRIPTQAVSSIQAMRCVDVLPVICHTVILPKEITAVTGSDFDIDKFFLSTYFYKSIIEDNEIQSKIDELDLKISEFKEQKKPYLEGAKKYKALSDRINDENNRIKGILSKKKQTDGDLAAIERSKLRIALFEKERESYDSDKQKYDAINEQMKPFVKERNDLWSDNYKIKHTAYKSESGNDVSVFDAGSSEEQCNKLLRYQIKLLSTVHNNLATLLGSIDSDTKPLQDIADKIRSSRTKNELHAMDALSMKTNVESKIAFAVGKKGIGPYALNNNNHVFTMLYNVRFKHSEGSILDILNLEDLSSATDQHGHSILSWLSGLINAHVDVAKDPFIRELGVNKYTYNLVSLLIRTGYGEETFWFTTLPIMRKLYKAFDSAYGVYGLPEGTTSGQRTAKVVKDFYIDYVNSVIKDSDCFALNKANDAVEHYFSHNYGKDISEVIKLLMKTETGVNIMEQLSTSDENKNQDKTFDIGLGKDISFKDIQMLVLYVNFKLQDYAKELSNLVQYTKIDTKKQGTTLSEQDAYLSGYESLLDVEKTKFEIEGIKNMLNNSFIGKKTKIAINMERRLLSSLLLLATRGYSGIMKALKQELGVDEVTSDYVSILHTMILTKIKSDFFFSGSNSYCARRDIDPMELLTDMNGNSIYSKLNRIKSLITDPSNHDYDDIRNELGVCNNYLLNNILSGNVFSDSDIFYAKGNYNRKRPYIAEFDDMYSNSQFIARFNSIVEGTNLVDMKNAWADLLNDSNHPELQRFAEELIVYAFITSVGTNESGNLWKCVPEQWMYGNVQMFESGYTGDTFGQYIEKVINTLNSMSDTDMSYYSSDDLELLILNFSYTDDIIPLINEDTIKNYSKFNLVKKADEIPGSADIPLFMSPVKGILSKDPQLINNFGNYPRYIKIKNPDHRIATGLYKYLVYKAEYNGKLKLANGQTVSYPIYTLMNPHGGLYKNEKQSSRIFDVGFNTNIDDGTNNYFKPFYYYYFVGYENIDPEIYEIDKKKDDKKKDDKKKLYELVKRLNSIYTKHHNYSDGSIFLIEDYVKNRYIRDGADIFNELLGIIAKGPIKIEITPEYEASYDNGFNFKVLKAMIDNTLELLNDNTNGTDKSEIPTARERYKQYVNYMESKGYPVVEAKVRDRFSEELYKSKIADASAKTALHVENKSSKYNPVNEDEFFENTGLNKEEFYQRLEAGTNGNIHVEFYTKKSEIGGKETLNYVYTLSIKGKNNSGFFEVVLDKSEEDLKENNEYSIHFNTFNAKHPDTRFANIQLSNADKTLLFRAVISTIPNGGLVSTHGTLTKGGLNAMFNILNYGDISTGFLFDSDNLREVKVKGEEDSTLIPIYIKSSNEEQAYVDGVSESGSPEDTGNDNSEEESILLALDKNAEDMECKGFPGSDMF